MYYIFNTYIFFALFSPVDFPSLETLGREGSLAETPRDLLGKTVMKSKKFSAQSTKNMGTWETYVMAVMAKVCL